MNEATMNEATKRFIIENVGGNVFDLALQVGKYPGVDMPFAVRQIEGRQKMRLKVPAFFAEDNLLYPARLSLEQASSEVTARYKSSLCKGNVLIDLTGGFGIDSFFLSQHFGQSYYIERNKELCLIAGHNFQIADRKNIEVVCAEAGSFLNDFNGIADWIYIDPARRDNAGKKTVLLADCEPDVNKIHSQLLAKARRTLIKLSPMIDAEAVLRDVPHISQIHILAVDNECKELLFVLDKNNTKPLAVRTRNFVKTNTCQSFDFEPEEEKNAAVNFAATLGKYLYEPNAAIMKSAAFKLTAQRYNMYKLHANTHLYTSDSLTRNFPGRIFDVVSLWGNSKSAWKNRLKTLSKANVSVRNYPVSADDLRKKLKLKDGGDTFLFACTLANGEKTIIECKKTAI
ncbi:MAG: SAM-dependent methyltransferase [Prevotellaceae bacterium]|jgi:hypothetical protein|nr:SAM-dependent methyltransferase [Prevotellaceae bacterium]